MNKFQLIVITALLLPFFSFAQTEVKEGEVQWLHAIKKEPYDKIDGSPYYFDWGKGSIKLKDGTVYQNLSLNYDIYKSLIHVKNETQGLVAVHTELIESVEITTENITHLFKPFKSEDVGLSVNQGGDIYTRFYEVLHEGGKYGYYKLPIKIFQKEESLTPDKAYSVDKTEGQFNYRHKHYMKLPSGKFEAVPPRKKAFISAFGDNAEVLKAYIKKEKPTFSQVEDLQKMLNFMENNTN